MASPDVFRSPKSRTPRRESSTRSSSSPDFPSLNDMVTNSPTKPPFYTPKKSKATLPNSQRAAFGVADEQLDNTKDVSLISLHSSDGEPGHETRAFIKTTRKSTASSSKYFEGDHAWKKFKSPPRATTPGGVKQAVEASLSAAPIRSAAPTCEKDASLIVLDTDEPLESAHVTGRSNRSKTKEPEEPLCLEHAPGRRPDWTPPIKSVSTHIDLHVESSAVKDANTSTQGDDNSGVFRNLLQTYGCDAPQPESVVVSEEDSSFLKKRKLIELVTTADGAQSPPVSPDKTRSKPKATKKKPRTITELATAAYQRPAVNDDAASTQDIRPFVQTENGQDAEASGKTGKGKAKAKPARKSKKATAKSKKKIEHPLLSPGAALKQSAAQDFLFGTSSQLAREQSPTLLRDIQMAMKNSNLEMDGIDEVDQFLDDTEPTVRRRSLWDAAARDEGGGLLDIELVDLADDTSQSANVDESGDPFGYSKPDDVPALPNANASFETLSDLLPAPRAAASDIDEKSVFSLSDISVSTDIRKPDPPPAQSGLPEQVTEIETVSSTIQKAKIPEHPNFDLCTDAQLAMQIKGYGFKAVKRRSAMIGLLEQCWRSKHGISESAARAFTTASAQSRPRKESVTAPATAGTPSPKPRGRPRKSTPSSPVAIQEPPPSAQPIDSPKRPRGRPRKIPKADDAPVEGDAAVAATSIPPKKGRSRSLKKTTATDAEVATVKPKRKPKQTKTTTKAPLKTTPAPRPITPVERGSAKSQAVLEIPDSESDQDSDGTVQSASPEPTFSPSGGVDLSVSMEEDVSLLTPGSPSASQSSVFERITEAVTTAPRSTDPSNPSWHEKILMYDPVILEDLTSWLNSGQLSRVGHDDEVSPAEVKKWCESQSVCCLWRLNMRGASRKRY